MSPFTLQWPPALWLLLLVLPFAGLLAHARRHRRAVIEAMGGGHSTHRRSRDSLRVAAFALLTLALARPGYAPQVLADTRAGRDVVFALDVSRSMLAQDVPPSRLEVARQAIRDALRTFRNERVGLVAYAGSATILCPLTDDYDFVRYMLQQATPRTVDFGGTTLQSAVEKAADQVFLEGRGNVQDLIILTDGGDHGSQVAQVAEMLDTKQIDALILGLGDSERASPIPIEYEQGTVNLLESGGQTVYTKLDDAALRDFASMSARARYVAAGTTPFNLGRIYREYAAAKPVEVAQSETGFIVYREAAWWLIFPALALLCLTERLGARGLRLALLTAICVLFLPGESRAETSVFQRKFETALGHMQAESYQQAAQTLAKLYQRNSGQSPAALAVVRFNHGLCLTQLSSTSSEQDPRAALASARQAQQAFLAAKRHNPALDRAGRHVQAITARIAELRTRIEAQEETAEKPEQTPSEESGEPDDLFEEDYDETDASGESMSSSQPMTGDFAAGTEMQPLPTPNYSAEEILAQEAGNLQFRQQKRSGANAGKVEKDY